jgi:hypothetical protein
MTVDGEKNDNVVQRHFENGATTSTTSSLCDQGGVAVTGFNLE